MRRSGALLLTVVLTVVLAGCDWSMFGFDAAHTRLNSLETMVSRDNVSSLTLRYTALLDTGSSSPAVANGKVYVGSTDGKLYAFDAAGTSNCAGSPLNCTPLWTAATGDQVYSSPAVANGTVYVGSQDHKLYAFDARGSTNCSGTPKTCRPLWTATTGGGVRSSPVVAGGVVYVGSTNGKVYAYDAAGNTLCSGTPKVCSPLWRVTIGAAVETSPAVANGVLYITAGQLYAFEAAGTHCSGMPKTCAPLWTAPIGVSGATSSPAVANGVVYVGSADGKLYAVDAAGVTSCSGAPKTCAPLWTADANDDSTLFGGVTTSPAIANGVVFVGSGDHKLYAFDSGGTANCSGMPKTCAPLWTATTGNFIFSSPAVANGVVYVGSYDTMLYAFDATGVTNCSGTPTTTCAPLWSAEVNDGVASSPAVADGVIYLASSKLYAFAVPPHVSGDNAAASPTINIKGDHFPPQHPGQLSVVDDTTPSVTPATTTFTAATDGTFSVQTSINYQCNDVLHISASVGPITADGTFDATCDP